MAYVGSVKTIQRKFWTRAIVAEEVGKITRNELLEIAGS